MGALAWFGFTPFLKIVNNTIQQGSPAGSTFGTAKFAGVAVNLASPGANGTSTSILNGDASDRYISSIKAGCQGVGSSNTAYVGGGLASLQLTVATSTTAAPATNSNTNSVGGGAVVISTSTAVFGISTSTIAGNSTSPGITKVYFVWASNSYLTFTTNATNTAACTFGVDYFGA